MLLHPVSPAVPSLPVVLEIPRSFLPPSPPCGSRSDPHLPEFPVRANTAVDSAPANPKINPPTSPARQYSSNQLPLPCFARLYYAVSSKQSQQFFS